MAFRRRFNSRRRFSSFRGRGRGARASSQKWVGFHELVTADTFDTDPPSNQMIIYPMFIPLVAVNDYSDLEATTFVEDQAQEKSLIKRSIGQFHAWMPNVAGEVQYVFAVELWWYFGAMSRDDIANAADLLVADPSSGATDSYDLGLATAPPLWRRPVKRWGTDLSFHSVGIDDNITQTEYDGQQIISRSWDFNPSAPIRLPMEWYLVMGANLYFVTPVSPPDQAILVYVAARTLIAD